MSDSTLTVGQLRERIQAGTVTDTEMHQWILDQIGSWTAARWDQWLRYEFGDELANRAIETLKRQGTAIETLKRQGIEIRK